MFHTLETFKIMGDFTSDTAVANLAKLMSQAPNLKRVVVKQYIWYNANNMRKIDIKVSESMEERDDWGHLLGGTIGQDLS